MWKIGIVFLILFLIHQVFLRRKNSRADPENANSTEKSTNDAVTQNEIENKIWNNKDEKDQSSEFKLQSIGQDSEVSEKSAVSKVRPRKVVRAQKKIELREITLNTDSPVIIFYSTLTGSSEKYARIMKEELETVMTKEIEIMDLSYIDGLDQYFCNPSKALNNYVYLFVLPSYEIECPLDETIELLQTTLKDKTAKPWPLTNLAGFSIFGIGDKESWPEESKFCYQAIKMDRLLGKLGARRISPLGTGCVKSDLKANFQEYLDLLKQGFVNPTSITHDFEDLDDALENENNNKSEVQDMEDIKGQIDDSEVLEIKEMVAKDSPTYKALTKQGYTIVGSHSGVKTCRWTKHALRGRGSCYKFAFYGIKSHLCMETTPSLSCSNKCVFCWRHGTNPVGTTWRWKVDQPEVILEGALAGHYQKIKQMRGVPGVQAARFAEAFNVRHCALSLVGEPIFYPYINEFVGMLHEKQISSFLVCNAQHPDNLQALKRVTQLYVSIDASDKKSLRKVDRPLHKDFWERFIKCLDIIRTRTEQRTVYRLTLVKGFNGSDIEGYADMVERGMPCFIEVKGVTFCGATNPLRMSNVPFYDEVVDFVEALNLELKHRGLDYDIATEHAHSCCILLAQKRFKIDGKWFTHIDYPKFFELVNSGKEFGPMDYIAETPEFALYGSKHQGFNPEDVRFRRKAAENRANLEKESSELRND